MREECVIWFSAFDPEEISFYMITNSLSGSESVGSPPNALNRWFMTLQNQLTIEELNPENKALFHNSCTTQYMTNKRKIRMTINDNHAVFYFTDRTCSFFEIKFIILSWILLAYYVIINIVFYIKLLHF